MNHTFRNCSRCPLTDEEREVANIEREIEELQEKRDKILSKKSKYYAKSLIDMADKVSIQELDSKTVIYLS